MGVARLSQALRLPEKPRLALVGAGGKTTAMFRIARELLGSVMVTASTHLGISQIQLADRHFIIQNLASLADILPQVTDGVTLLTGPIGTDERTGGLASDALEALHAWVDAHELPLLLEADGSRQKPLKAPAEHEPALPEWVDQVVVAVGMSGIGQPLNSDWVHRPEIYSALSGIVMGDLIGPLGAVRELVDPRGGLKRVPPDAEVSLLLNQADTEDKIAQANQIASLTGKAFARVVIASLGQKQIHAVIEPAAGVILAAGDARRMGQTKQLLDWHGQPFVRRVAETALGAGLWPVVVVSGAAHTGLEQALAGLPVQLVHNPDWANGQGSSVAVGVRALPKTVGSAVFLLADQPQIGGGVVARLIDSHAASLDPITAPVVHGKRANPVLFDRSVFSALRGLSGEAGGRAVFAQYPVTLLDWPDVRLLLDVDTPEDYQRLLELG